MDQTDSDTTGGATGTTGAFPPGVATALEQLESLGALPVAAHVAAFEEVQRSLDDALADIDGAPGGTGGQPRPPAVAAPVKPKLDGSGQILPSTQKKV